MKVVDVDVDEGSRCGKNQGTANPESDMQQGGEADGGNKEESARILILHLLYGRSSSCLESAAARNCIPHELAM